MKLKIIFIFELIVAIFNLVFLASTYPTLSLIISSISLISSGVAGAVAVVVGLMDKEEKKNDR